MAEQSPAALTLLAFYRGSFCRFCRGFLQRLNELQPEFARRGVLLIAVSVDTDAQATAMKAEHGLTALPIGHGLTRDQARSFGLFMSRVERAEGAREFAEPALFLIRPDSTVYAVIQNSVSCGRPDLLSLLDGIDVLAGQGFPLRGNA